MHINSPEDMFAYGKVCTEKHSNVLLYGDLWAGKTTFTKGFAAGLGIDYEQVHSPTYTYIHVYEDKLIHADLYRISDAQELVDKAILHEILQYPYAIIERPEIIEKMLNLHERTKIQILIDTPTTRIVGQ